MWDARQSGRSRPWFVRLQAWAWFLVVLPLTFPLFLAMAVAGAAITREWWRIALTAARWAVAIWLFGGSPLLLLGPVCAAGYLLAFCSA